MICKNCGIKIPEEYLKLDSFSCPKCNRIYRRKLKQSRQQTESTVTSSGTVNTTRRHPKIQRLIGLIILIFILIVLVCELVDFISPEEIDYKSLVVDYACSHVRTIVFDEYGILPDVSGELIYESGFDQVVAVKYLLPSEGWGASRACLVKGAAELYGVMGMTNEQTYNYNYKANMDRVKEVLGLSD